MMMSPSLSPSSREESASLSGSPPLGSASMARPAAAAWRPVSSFAISCVVGTTVPRTGRETARSAGTAVLVDGRASCMVMLQDART